MAASQPTEPRAPPQADNSRANHKKLATLPSNARVSKRPLIHPAIPSPHSGASTPKHIYVSAHTPFLGAVKRVEKLLGLAEKRAMQSAITLAKQNSRNQRSGGAQKRKRGAAEEGDDEVMDVAKSTEEEKVAKRRRRNGKGGSKGNEEDVVIIKGSGKAVQRVLEMGLWFQQREEYVVKLSTGSVGTVDDVSIDSEKVEKIDFADERDPVNENAEQGSMDALEQPPPQDNAEPSDQPPKTDDRSSELSTTKQKTQKKREGGNASVEDVPETRIRYMSVLNVIVSLR